MSPERSASATSRGKGKILATPPSSPGGSRGPDRSLRRNLDIRGLEIPVHDAFVVGRFERIDDLPGDRQRISKWQRPAGETLRQRIAFNQLQLHHERASRLA